MALTDTTGPRRCRGLLLAAIVLVGSVGAACSGSDDADDSAAGAATTGASVVAPSTAASTPPTTSLDQALAAGRCPEPLPWPEPDPDRPRYQAEITADPDTGQVSGSVSIAFTPDLPVDQVVLRLWANAPRPAAVGTRAGVDDVRVDGRPVTPLQPDPTTVVLPLDGEHPAGEPLDLSMALSLHVEAGARDRIDRAPGVLRLGSFLPLLPWVPGEGWATDPPTALFAEAATTPVADMDLTLAVPDGYDVLATGVPDGSGRWRAEAVRDVAATIGRFEVASRVVDAPDAVEVTVGVDAGVAEDPEAYLDRVAMGLTDFAARFGPYPWPSLTLAVTPGLAGGIEMPMHVMQGPETIGRTTPHEVAHMWFYSLVGNNQARDPWLDEALASYAEATLEGTVDDFRATAAAGAIAGTVGQPLTYWADRSGAYYESVYQQGALALVDLGEQWLVDCALRHYVADQAHGIAEPADLLEVLATFLPDAPGALSAAGIATD